MLNNRLSHKQVEWEELGLDPTSLCLRASVKIQLGWALPIYWLFLLPHTKVKISLFMFTLLSGFLFSGICKWQNCTTIRSLTETFPRRNAPGKRGNAAVRRSLTPDATILSRASCIYVWNKKLPQYSVVTLTKSWKTLDSLAIDALAVSCALPCLLCLVTAFSDILLMLLLHSAGSPKETSLWS